jgi:hypothetical protein
MTFMGEHVWERPEVKKKLRESRTELLANRMAYWMPDQTEEQIRQVLCGLTDQQFNQVFADCFKRNLTHNLLHSSRILAENGWFLDFGGPPQLPTGWAEMFQRGESEAAHLQLEDYFRERRAGIEEELARAFPERSALLSKGFKFHDREEYDVAIPMFLIQADGICYRVFEEKFFGISGGALAARKNVEGESDDSFWMAVSEPFRMRLPIAASKKPNSTVFNRHIILHGTNLNYGTRRNSLRSISLLAYLVGMSDLKAQVKKRGDVAVEPA